jgi:hypothetical protein
MSLIEPWKPRNRIYRNKEPWNKSQWQKTSSFLEYCGAERVGAMDVGLRGEVRLLTIDNRRIDNR